MSAISAAYDYIERSLSGLSAPVRRDVMEGGERQERKVATPAVLAAFMSGADDYTFGEDRAAAGETGRQHYHDLRFAVRAVVDDVTDARAEALAHEIDKALNPGGDPPAGWSAANPGYAVVLCLRLEALRGVDDDPPDARGAKKVRWLIGGRYKVVIQGDGAA